MKLDKKVIFYIIEAIALCFIVFLINAISNYIGNLSKNTFDTRPFILLTTLLYVFSGSLLALNHLFDESRKKGSWKINSKRLFFLGIPMLLIVMIVFLWFFGFIQSPIIFQKNVIYLLGIIIGYEITTCVIKSEIHPKP